MMAQVLYTRAEMFLTLDNPAKQYVLKIRDLPDEQRPRERLAALGPGALSAHELLAIILATGTVKEEVLSMTARILKEYGEKSLLSRSDVRAMAADLDIPQSKAAQIIACGELGRRFFLRNGAGAAVIRTAKDVYQYAVDMRTLAKEHLRGLYLNSHYHVIHDEIISIGTVDANMVHPREVFKPALEYSAAAVILVHNHPSGILAPSEADRTVTEQLRSAGALLGINLIDHVIVSQSGFASIPFTTE